jgi:hypothetical protein
MQGGFKKMTSGANSASDRAGRDSERGSALIYAMIMAMVTTVTAVVVLQIGEYRLKELKLMEMRMRQHDATRYYRKVVKNARSWSETKDHNVSLRHHLNSALTSGSAVYPRAALALYDVDRTLLIPTTGLCLDKDLNERSGAGACDPPAVWKITAFWEGMKRNNAVVELVTEYIPQNSDDHLVFKDLLVPAMPKHCVTVSDPMTKQKFMDYNPSLGDIGWILGKVSCQDPSDSSDLRLKNRYKVSYKLMDIHMLQHPFELHAGLEHATDDISGICATPSEQHSAAWTPQWDSSRHDGDGTGNVDPLVSTWYSARQDVDSDASQYNVCYATCCAEDD